MRFATVMTKVLSVLLLAAGPPDGTVHRLSPTEERIRRRNQLPHLNRELGYRTRDVYFIDPPTSTFTQWT
jgi:hypothetical protein